MSINRRDVLKTIAGTAILGMGGIKLSGSADATIINSEFYSVPERIVDLDFKNVLLKNQQIFNESYQNESFNEAFKDFTLKVIDKFCDKIVSKDLFILQPFTQKEGLAFYLTHTTIKNELQLALESMALKCESFNTQTLQRYYLKDDDDNSFVEDLTNVVADELAIKIDRKNIYNCMNNAGTIASWDFKNALGDTIIEKYEHLYVKIVEVSSVIHRKTLRGGANWIVTSPEVASIFETATAGFAPSPSETFTSSFGIQYVGTVNNRFKLYKDPLFPKNKILLGYKESPIDAGYVYCPHLIFSDYSQNCVVNSSASGFIRNGENYYSLINVSNFPF